MSSIVVTVFCGLLLLLAVFLIRRLRQTRCALKRQEDALSELESRLLDQQDALFQLFTKDALFDNNLDEAFQQVCQKVAETLGAEEASVWLLRDDTATALERKVRWCHRKAFDTPPPSLEEKNAPNYFRSLKEQRTINVPSVALSPFAKELAYLLPFGIESTLDAPIIQNGKNVGALCIGSSFPRRWTIDEENFAVSAASILSLLLGVREQLTIKEQLARKSAAIEAASDGIAILERGGAIHYANQAFGELFGYSRDELKSISWRDLLPQNEETNALLSLESFTELEEHPGLRIEGQALHRSGSFFFVELSLSPLNDEDAICILRDVGSQKEAFRNAHEFATLATLNPAPIIRFDERGRVILANAAAVQVFNLQSQIGIPNIHDLFQDLSAIDLEECVRTGKILTLSTAVGEQYFHLTLRGIPEFGYGQVYASDITKTKALQEQLVQTQKMEAVGLLAGGVAHDFNNLLTGILGYANLLRVTKAKDAEVVSTAQQIEETAQRAGQLTQKLLAYARQGKHQNISLDIHQLIEDTLELLGRTFEESIALQTNLQAKSTCVMGDPVQLQQVILNLSVNARDAILEKNETAGGRLTIKTRSLVINKSTPLTTGDLVLSPGKYLQLSVSDTGCGIPEENLRRVFDPFFSTKPEEKGSGMGLAMVYGIVSNHSGVITVESDLDKGTTFTVYLPSTQKPSHLRIEKKTYHIEGGEGQVLLVDDHDLIRSVTSDMLKQLGYDVVTANDGVEALQYYAENWEKVDLVILDLIMPRMGAKECLAKLQEINPEVRAILTTGYVNNHVVQDLIKKSDIGFMQKPFELAKLSRIVSHTMSH